MIENRCETCYWCGKRKTSKEHVPPKCIFPEQKDTHNAKNYRKNLITVPSCDTHNLSKSKDDEYLLCILAINILNNNAGSDQAKTKVKRALDRSAGLKNLIFDKTEPIIIKEKGTQNYEKTLAISVDIERLESCFEHITRAIYYHHFKKIWKGSVQCISEFNISLGEQDALEQNNMYENFRHKSDAAFKDCQIHGPNKDIFHYQISENSSNDDIIAIRLIFYGGTKVTSILKLSKPA